MKPLSAPSECTNCGVQVSGMFCSTCGQRATGRLQLGELSRLAREKLLNSEQGLLPTLRYSVTSPGKIPRDYIDGKRRRYFNPFTFFILAASSQLLMIGLHGDAMTATMTDGLHPSMLQQLSERGIEDPKVFMAERYLLLMKNAYTWLAALTMVLPVALMMRVFLSGRGVNFAETLVWAFYSLGAVILFTGVVGCLTLPITGMLHGTVIAPGIYLLYLPFAAYGCFGPGIWPPMAGFIATFLGFFCFLIVLMIGFILIMFV